MARLSNPITALVAGTIGVVMLPLTYIIATVLWSNGLPTTTIGQVEFLILFAVALVGPGLILRSITSLARLGNENAADLGREAGRLSWSLRAFREYVQDYTPRRERESSR